jgi:hypothetical protein
MLLGMHHVRLVLHRSFSLADEVGPEGSWYELPGGWACIKTSADCKPAANSKPPSAPQPLVRSLAAIHVHSEFA